MTALVHCIHMDPSMRARYEAALAPLGDFDLVFVPIAGPLSSSYAQLAGRLRVSGRILPQLWAKHPGRRPVAQYEGRFLLHYSAGYKFVEAVLASTADRDAVDGIIALDSIHAALDGDGTASDRQVEHWVEYAQLARDSRKLFWVGHSDVQTTGYASTTKTAAELVRLAGGTGGLFHVRAYDVRPADAPKAEHGAALTEWGPAFVAEAFAARGVLAPPTDPAPGGHVLAPPVPLVGTGWGSTISNVAAWWLNKCPREDKGKNRGDAIDAWLRATGVALGSPYCAAFGSAVIREAATLIGRETRGIQSAGAKMMGALFRKAFGEGAVSTTPDEMCRRARPGDLVIKDRSLPGPGERGPEGHFQFFLDHVNERAFDVIEGNADRVLSPDGTINAVCQSECWWNDPDLLYMCHWPD